MKQKMQKSRIYKIQTEEPKPKKKKNEKNRKRNVFMNFRVSEKERELIEKRIALSGMTKAEFFIQSCLYQAIFVKGNIRTFDKGVSRKKWAFRYSKIEKCGIMII